MQPPWSCRDPSAPGPTSGLQQGCRVPRSRLQVLGRRGSFLPGPVPGRAAGPSPARARLRPRRPAGERGSVTPRLLHPALRLPELAVPAPVPVPGRGQQLLPLPALPARPLQLLPAAAELPLQVVPRPPLPPVRLRGAGGGAGRGNARPEPSRAARPHGKERKGKGRARRRSPGAPQQQCRKPQPRARLSDRHSAFTAPPCI